MSDYTSLLPSSGVLMTDLMTETMPSVTYAMQINAQAIYGYVDEREAVKQAIYKILRTERYTYPVYSWDYGIELIDLFGKPTPYVEVELKRRIKEALEWDDRINKVDSFVFSYPEDKNTVYVQFTAHTIFGDIESDYNYGILEDTTKATDPYWYVDGQTLTSTWRAVTSIHNTCLYLPTSDQQTVTGTCLTFAED